MTTTKEDTETISNPPELAEPGVSERAGWSSWIGAFQGNRESGFLGRYALLGVWLLLAAFFGIVKGNLFLTEGTFQTIFGSQQAYIFLGMAAVITFSVGEFDLSIASLMGFAASLVPILVVNHGWDPATASVFAVACCAGFGLVNALIIVRLGIDAIVTTLGMGTLILGLSSKFSNGGTVSGLSSHFAKISNTDFLLGLPLSFYYGFALVLMIAYVMRFTALGRHMAFVGENREVSRLGGIRVNRIRMGSYIMSGILCGIGGVILVSGLGGFDSSTSPNFLLPALSATFLGTAAIRPGRFNALGTMVAIYFLITGIVGLQLLGYTGWVSEVFYGSALIIAIIISTLARRRALGAD